MTFGEAIEALNDGQLVAREGWNGRGMALFYVNPAQMRDVMVSTAPWLPFIAMRTAQGTLVPWLASQTDVLADDWLVAT